MKTNEAAAFLLRKKGVPDYHNALAFPPHKQEGRLLLAVGEKRSNNHIDSPNILEIKNSNGKVHIRIRLISISNYNNIHANLNFNRCTWV